ncbi:cytochrome c-type biogenesis protein CcmH [Cupriavidus campinensis]
MRRLCLACLLWMAFSAQAAEDAALDARAHALADQLRCLVCQNQSLADSDADLAVDLRGQIREQLRQGASEAAVKDYLVARYGDFVLYEPPMRPQTWLLWFGPLLLVVGATAAIVRQRRRHPAGPRPALAARHPPAGAGAPPGRSRWVIGATLATLPVAATLLYLHLGRPGVLWGAWLDAPLAAPGGGEHSADMGRVEAMVSRLALRLRKTPDDPGGWYTLARSYGAMERFDDAAAAYARAVALVPDAAALRADYADALASAGGGQLEGPAMEQVRIALALDPDEPKALALAGTAAAERGALAEAIGYWEHLYRLLPADSETAKRVAGNIAAARGGS